jgi:hypothetical protein
VCEVNPAWSSIKRQNRLNNVLAETTMSDPRLPTEMLGHIVDNLHDTEDALRNCCLVSKSWVPRTRKHLFADIKFPTKANLRSWKKTFSDPSTSPAHYANTLSIGYPHAVTAADVGEGGWITGFPCTVHLEVGSRGLLAGSFRSTDSHPLSNPSACTFPPFRPGEFSVSSFHADRYPALEPAHVYWVS